MRHALTAAALGAALCAAAPAAAATITISETINKTGGPSYWTDSATFNLPANAIGTKMTILFASADDRFVTQLNGTDVIAAGIFAPGTGTFFYTPDGPGVSREFLANGNQNVVVTSGFVTGLNTVKFIVNDTNAGIYGDLNNGAGGPAGPTNYGFVANIDYSLSNAVPEPGTWALLILGFGATGAAMRRRTATRVSFA